MSKTSQKRSLPLLNSNIKRKEKAKNKSQLTKEKRLRLKKIEKEIEQTRNVMAASFKPFNVMSDTICSLKQEKEAILDFNGLIAKKDEEIKKWHKRALDAEKLVESSRAFRTRADEIYFNMEFPIHNLKCIIAAWREVHSPDAQSYLEEQMFRKSSEIIEIYEEAYSEKVTQAEEKLAA